MSRRIFGSIFAGLLITGAVAAVIAPREYWQNASWVPYREYAGEFSGRPVVMTPPSIGLPTIPLAYRIQMTKGVCQITRVDGDGNLAFRSSMGAGYVGRDCIAADGRLTFDPGPNTGRYQSRNGAQVPFAVAVSLAGPTAIPFCAGIDTRPHLIASAPVLQQHRRPFASAGTTMGMQQRRGHLAGEEPSRLARRGRLRHRGLGNMPAETPFSTI